MFNCVLISGGATKGMISLGVLSKYDISGVNTYVGTSVGAVLCTLLSMGLPVDEIYQIGRESKCDLPVGLQWVGKLYSLFSSPRLGLLEKNTYLDKVKEVIEEKYDHIPTMKELHDQTGKKLLICASAILGKKRIIFSYETHPNLSILEALEMSVRLPLIFTPIHFDGDLYVDGGVISHFPIDLREGRTLAIHTYNKVREVDEMIKDPSLIEFIGLLLACSSPVDVYPIDGVVYDIAYAKGHTGDEFDRMFKIGFNAIPLYNN